MRAASERAAEAAVTVCPALKPLATDLDEHLERAKVIHSRAELTLAER